MARREILYATILAIAIVLLLQSHSYAQRGRRIDLNIRAMTGAIQREYQDYVGRISFVRNAMGKAPGSKDAKRRQLKDPEGLIFVSDILKYKGKRRHRLISKNDAEQLLIQAVESVKNGNYDRAFTLTKEALGKDNTYMRAHLLLAGLYEGKGDIANMEKEYRYYLKKTLFLRKMMEAKTGWPDIDLEVIKEKFKHYDIPITDPALMSINMRYLLIGAACIALILFMIIFLMRYVYL